MMNSNLLLNLPGHIHTGAVVPSVKKKSKRIQKATIRCIPFNQSGEPGKCIVCGAKAEEKAYIAKAY